jgi:hypothetical protein
MRSFIRIVLGMWLLVVILLAAALVSGHVLGSDGLITFQSPGKGSIDLFLLDVPTRI